MEVKKDVFIVKYLLTELHTTSQDTTRDNGGHILQNTDGGVKTTDNIRKTTANSFITTQRVRQLTKDNNKKGVQFNVMNIYRENNVWKIASKVLLL